MTHFENLILKLTEVTFIRFVAFSGDSNVITVILLIAVRYWGKAMSEMLLPSPEVRHVSLRLPTIISRNVLGTLVWFDISHKRNDSNNQDRKLKLSPHPHKLINYIHKSSQWIFAWRLNSICTCWNYQMCIKWNKWGLPSHEAEHVPKREMSNILKLASWGFRRSYYPNDKGSRICVPINDRLSCRNAGRRWDCRAGVFVLGMYCKWKRGKKRSLKRTKTWVWEAKAVGYESGYEAKGFWEGWEGLVWWLF